MPEPTTAITSIPVPRNSAKARLPIGPGVTVWGLAAAFRATLGAALLATASSDLHDVLPPSTAVDMLTAPIDRCQYEDMRIIQPIDDCCPVLLEAPLREGDANTLAAALRVLADPGRLRLVSLIAAQPHREGCVCNLTGPLGLSQPTVSHHLKVLHEAGILSREKRGKWVYYRLVADPLRILSEALSVPAASGSQ
jgi:ArsR family transcriptional regulator, arsenate/arsenite/antimonite-responsive transcriptional repressor